MPNMDYSLIQRTPDGTGKILVTIPGSPDKGSYVLEADLKIYTNQGMVAIADIVDDLVTADATKPLSANQGVVLKQLIDAVSGGITPKGDILSTNLPAADDSNKGWQYYCTDLNKYATSDGTQWVYTSNSQIVQTPDATDTGHALSNAVVTQKCNAVEATLGQQDARLQNLEQKAGDYTVVQYRGTNAVPTGKAHYGLVKNIVGKTRAWNQLLNKSKIRSTYTTAEGITMTNNGDGSVTLTGTASADSYVYAYSSDSINLNPTHKYLFFGDWTITTKDSNNNTGYWYSASLLITGVVSFSQIFKRITSGTTANLKQYVGYRDLTLIGLDSATTPAEAIALLPSLGQYNPYDADLLVDTEVSGARSVGFNRLDNTTFVKGRVDNGVIGYASGTTSMTITETGVSFTVSTSYRGVASGLIAVKPSSEYYFKFTASNTQIRFDEYDANENWIRVVAATTSANGTFTTDANCVFIRISFQYTLDDGTADVQDINFNLSQPNTSVSPHNGDYLPYKTDTLSLPETVTLRSAGSVAEVLTLETGKKTRPIWSVDLGTLDWGYNSTNSYFYATLSDMKVIENGNVMPNFTCGRYEVISSRNNSAWADAKDKSIGTRQTTSLVCVKDSAYLDAPTFKTAMSGVYLNYELATPLSDEQVCDPIPDNLLEVEGGGTVETIQTQTPVIDNCLDVGYLAV